MYAVLFTQEPLRSAKKSRGASILVGSSPYPHVFYLEGRKVGLCSKHSLNR